MFTRRERYGRDDGRDQGRDKGRDKGRDETATFLYLKAFREIDGRDKGFFEILCSFLISKATYYEISAIAFPINGSYYSHLGNEMFPGWELNIPTLGICTRFLSPCACVSIKSGVTIEL